MSDLIIQSKIRPDAFSAGGKARGKSEGFSDFIKQAVKHVNDMEIEADRSIEKLAKGQVGIHETMISLQKADISLRLLLQVRNKAMDAYREVMRMQF